MISIRRRLYNHRSATGGFISIFSNRCACVSVYTYDGICLHHIHCTGMCHKIFYLFSTVENGQLMVYCEYGIYQSSIYCYLTYTRAMAIKTIMVPLDINSDNKSAFCSKNDELEQWCDLTVGF